MAELSMREAEDILEEELEALIEATSVDLEKLRPEITDKKTYDKLIAVVEESTRRNESLAELENRLKLLGTDAIRVGKKIAKLLKGV